MNIARCIPIFLLLSGRRHCLSGLRGAPGPWQAGRPKQPSIVGNDPTSQPSIARAIASSSLLLFRLSVSNPRPSGLVELFGLKVPLHVVDRKFARQLSSPRSRIHLRRDNCSNFHCHRTKATTFPSRSPRYSS